MDTQFTNLCPDDKIQLFHDDSVSLVKICVHMINADKQRKYPNEVRAELEALMMKLKGLSQEAKTALIFDSDVIPCDNLVGDLLEHIDDVIHRYPKGRPKRSPARTRIGLDSAAIWFGHGGDINSSDFVTYLEFLIEDVNQETEPPLKADAQNLANKVRSSLDDIAPNGWSF